MCFREIIFLCSVCCSHPGWSREVVGECLAWVEAAELGVSLIFSPVSIPILQLDEGWIFLSQIVVVASEACVVLIDPGVLVRVIVLAVLDESPLMLQEVSWGFERVGLCDWHDLESSVLCADLHVLLELDVGIIRWLHTLSNLNLILINPHELILNRSSVISSSTG